MSIYIFVVQQQQQLWRSLPRVKTELEQFHNCSFLEIDANRSQVNMKVRARDSNDAAHWSWVKGRWRWGFIWITCISFKGETSAQSCVVSTSVEQCVKKFLCSSWQRCGPAVRSSVLRLDSNYYETWHQWETGGNFQCTPLSIWLERHHPHHYYRQHHHLATSQWI